MAATKRNAFPNLEKLALKGILLIALLLRIAFGFYSPPDLADDTDTYLRLAQNLVEGKGYTLNGEVPTRVRTPTYPVFLTLIRLVFGSDPRFVLIAQSILGILTTYFTYLIAQRLFDRRVGLLAAFITACYPALIYYDTRILRESLTSFLVVSTVLVAVSSQKQTRARQIGAGTLIGVVSMCRPELMLLFVPVLYLINRPQLALGRVIRSGALVALPILVLWVPWTVRNYIHFGNLSPVAIGLKSTLWFGNRWAEIGGDDHIPEARKQLQAQNQALFQGATEATWEKHYEKEVWQDLLDRPGWFLQMTAQKTILFWKNANGVKKTLPAIHPILPLLMNAYYYGLLILALACLLLGYKKWDWVRPLVGVVFSYMIIYALLHVRNRYRVPILPIVFILSSGGVWLAYDLLKSKIKNPL